MEIPLEREETLEVEETLSERERTERGRPEWMGDRVRNA